MQPHWRLFRRGSGWGGRALRGGGVLPGDLWTPSACGSTHQEQEDDPDRVLPEHDLGAQLCLAADKHPAEARGVGPAGGVSCRAPHLVQNATSSPRGEPHWVLERAMLHLPKLSPCCNRAIKGVKRSLRRWPSWLRPGHGIPRRRPKPSRRPSGTSAGTVR